MIDDGLIVDTEGKEDVKEKEVYMAWVDEWAEWIMNELPSESGGSRGWRLGDWMLIFFPCGRDRDGWVSAYHLSRSQQGSVVG